MASVELRDLTIPELKMMLKVKGLDTRGNKSELIKRLQDNVPEYAPEVTVKYEEALHGVSHDQDDISPHDSISQHGSRSTYGSRSSTSSARAKAAAKRAALEAKASFFEQQQALNYRIKREKLRRELDRKEQEMMILNKKLRTERKN